MVRLNTASCSEYEKEFHKEYNRTMNLLNDKGGIRESIRFEDAMKEFNRDGGDSTGKCRCNVVANMAPALKVINQELDSRNKEINDLTAQWNKCSGGEGKKVLYSEPISSEVEDHIASADLFIA